jgi:type VI secretion system secreted protein Hcp
MMAKSDMFLKVDGAKQGQIKGEAAETGHVEEISVLGWNWGMDGNATAFGASTARTTLQELVIRKRVDSASTGLMSALRNNEPIKKAVLTVHKAGGTAPVPFLTITIEKARIISHRLGNAVDGEPTLTEEVRLAFFKVQVEYRQQDTTGAGKGVNTFETEVQVGS